LLCVLIIGLFSPMILFSKAENSEHWTIYHDSLEVGNAPIRLVGDETFLDVLSLCDYMEITYYKDEGDRYIISLPETPLVFVEDGSFAQIGLDIIHTPLPSFKDGVRFFVPEGIVLEVLEQFYPGDILINRTGKRIDYLSPESDLLLVDGVENGNEWRYRFILAKFMQGQIELIDSTHIAFTVPELHYGDSSIFIDALASMKNAVFVDKVSGLIKIETPRAIRGARLKGPNAGNLLTLSITMKGDGEEEEQPLTYDERSLLESLAEDRAKWKIDKIIVDPGHGGKDPGAVGRGRTREKNVALAISKALKKELEKRTGVDVVLTRDKDEFIPLGERTRIANRANGKLFISIHANANKNRRARGQETYFLSPARTERAMSVALKENSVIQLEEKRDNYPSLTEENFILLTMAQSQFVKESEEFASLIQSHMHRKTGLKNRGVDQAGFYVLIGASMPAVLVETAFISNPTEEGLLKKKSFQQNVADGICDAVVEFMDKYGE